MQKKTTTTTNNKTVNNEYQTHVAKIMACKFRHKKIFFDTCHATKMVAAWNNLYEVLP